MREVRIENKRVGENAPVFIIAEIGDTHAGRVDTGLRLIEAAARAGADAVKLQTISPGDSYVPGSPSHRAFTQLWLKPAELKRLQQAAKDLGLVFFSTPGEFGTLDLLLELDVPLIKISSGLMTNLPLVQRAAASRKPLLISTGMSTLDEVRETVAAAEGAGAEAIMLMHCASVYPAPPRVLNLLAIRAMASAFTYPVGYSDHYDGAEACIAAAALGARLLEKHFTLDRKAGGPADHLAADPPQMAALVRSVRDVEAMLGDGIKQPRESEIAGRDTYRRCLVARRSIAKGEPFSPENVGLKRPNQGLQGLHPRCYEAVLGRAAAVDIGAETSIQADMIAGGIDA